MAKKWNIQRQQYEPHTIPESWVCPLISMDMELPVNCASCGKPMKFGDGFTSHIIHSDGGFGYSVCGACHEKEWVAEKAAREEKNHADM